MRGISGAVLLLAAALAAILGGPSAPARAAPAGATIAPVLWVSGNHLADQNGNVVRLTGVNRSGAEYACAEGWGIWDGPTDTGAAIQAMVSWHINAVRIPLNEDCWLGINGVNPAYSGANYRAAIADYVKRLENSGITPILNLHFSAPGTTVPDGQAPMADEAHSPSFWASVAAYFSADHHLIFDLFNEPYPDSNRDATAAWQCVRDGGTCPGVSFPAAGMQQLVNVVRAAGATQPLMIAGPQYAGDVDQWLRYEPADPLHQLVASVHVYLPNSAPCGTETCWTTQLDPLATHVPVVIGELGSTDCTASSIEPLLDNADASGISYTAWAWNVGSCAGEPSLITNYSGTPTRTFGQGYRDHLDALHAEVTKPAGGRGSCGAVPQRPPAR